MKVILEMSVEQLDILQSCMTYSLLYDKLMKKNDPVFSELIGEIRAVSDSLRYKRPRTAKIKVIG